jgi:hypothetical protein
MRESHPFFIKPTMWGWPLAETPVAVPEVLHRTNCLPSEERCNWDSGHVPAVFVIDAHHDQCQKATKKRRKNSAQQVSHLRSRVAHSGILDDSLERTRIRESRRYLHHSLRATRIDALPPDPKIELLRILFGPFQDASRKRGE